MTSTPAPVKQPHSGFTRIPYNRCCTVRRGGKILEGVICNISVLGAYVTFEELPEVGDVLEIAFPVPGIDHPLRTAATVTWQNPDRGLHVDDLPPGCGLRFDSLPLKDGVSLATIVKDYLQNMPTQERPGPRIPYVQRCDLMAVGVSQAGVLCNLSEMGVYVNVQPAFEAGERLLVSFDLIGDPLPFRASATVTWQNLDEPATLDALPPGCGLRFDDLPEAERMRIRAAVKAYYARWGTLEEKQ